jgi:hypothetical protein
MGYAGHNHPTGATGSALTDHQGDGCAPGPVAPVNETDRVRLPQGWPALQAVAKEVGLDLRGAYCNLEGGLDAARQRQGLCADLCGGRSVQAPAAPLGTPPATALWDEAARGHEEQPASVLRYLKLATSYVINLIERGF